MDEEPTLSVNEREVMLLRFRQERSAVDSQWEDDQPRIPERLYHYTTLTGFKGIVDSGAIWASDVRYMNDASELTYASDLVASIAREEFAVFTDDSLQTLLRQNLEVVQHFTYWWNPFIACFCEEDDILSQWRAYGSGAAPVSMGLALESPVVFGELPGNALLRKVVYKRDEQERYIRESLKVWVASLQGLLATDPNLPSSLLGTVVQISLREAMAEYQLCFKHPSFEEEKEWRLIRLLDVREEVRRMRDEDGLKRQQKRDAELRARGITLPEWPSDLGWGAASRAEGVEILFRPSQLGLIPYVEVPIRDTAGVFSDLLPLWEARQGPTVSPDLAFQSLELFLYSRGYVHTEKTRSRIPLRQ